MATTVVNTQGLASSALVDIDITRPGMFGNPFRIGPDGDRDTVLLKYFEWFYAPERWAFRLSVRKLCKDKVLGCVCKPKRCHGDVIAAYCDAVTANTCPACGKRWEDRDPIAGIVHRTRLCGSCRRVEAAYASD